MNIKPLLIAVIALIVISCDSDKQATNNSSVEGEIESEVPKTDTSTNNTVTKSESEKTVSGGSVDSLFSPLELPLTIDYNYLMDYTRKEGKHRISYQEISDYKMPVDNGKPVYILTALGSIAVNDSTEMYVIIQEPNPDIAVDFADIIAYLAFKEGDWYVVVEQIAKYYSGSGLRGEYYCTIEKDGTIKQNYKQTGEYENTKEVLKKGDTTFYLSNYIN